MSIEIGQKYKHYKNQQVYEIVGFAHDTEANQKLVLYMPHYSVPDLEPDYPDGVVFARPIAMFSGSVEFEGKTSPRFQLVKQ